MVFDILLDETTNDLVATPTGDFRTGDATNIDQLAIVISAPGHFKEFPSIGVGIFQFLNGTSTSSQIERAIRVQMAADIFPQSLVDASKFPIVVVNSLNVKLTP
jgi:hypothetical protein